MSSAELIERFEYKYLVPDWLVPPIRATALGVGARDRHADPSTGTYLIRSLYLDTDRMDLFWANEREQRRRFKARVRGYPGKASAPVFLELKSRIGDVIVKSRAAAGAREWPDLLEGRSPAGGRALSQFVATYQLYHLRPVVVVEYEREPFVSAVDDYARITLDRRVVCQRTDRLDLSASPGAWRPVDHDVREAPTEPVTVLELKFERRPPRWMVDLVRRLDLVRRSFSKYCFSVEAQHLLPTSRQASGGGW